MLATFTAGSAAGPGADACVPAARSTSSAARTRVPKEPARWVLNRAIMKHCDVITRRLLDSPGRMTYIDRAGARSYSTLRWWTLSRNFAPTNARAAPRRGACGELPRPDCPPRVARREDGLRADGQGVDDGRRSVNSRWARAPRASRCVRRALAVRRAGHQSFGTKTALPAHRPCVDDRRRAVNDR